MEKNKIYTPSKKGNIQKNEKIINFLKIELILSMVLQLCSIIITLLLKSFTIYNILYITILISSIICFLKLNFKKNFDEKIGFSISIMLILTILFKNIINLILGILILINSIKFIKQIKSNQDKDNKLFLINLGIILITIIIILIVKISDNKLECTRSNGDNIIVEFDKKGIKKLYINKEQKNGITYLNYVSNFIITFINNENDIKEYKKIVKQYEKKEYDAVCK